MTEARAWSGTYRSDRYIFADNDCFDFVTAGRGDDYISDGRNASIWSTDYFRGQIGDDTLISTGGNDILRGGKGDDTFITTVGYYDANDVMGRLHRVGNSDLTGFEVTINGGVGHDVLTVKNSDGYWLETHGEKTIIHTDFGGTITVRNVEEFVFL